MEMAVKFPGGKLVTSNYNGFEVTTDLPKSEGGEGTAPSPYALFLASMGNCAGIYVLYFCQSRHISTDGVSLALSFDFDKKTYLATKIDINVKLPEDFPEKYRKGVLKAAEMCAVKQTLIRPPEVNVNAA